MEHISIFLCDLYGTYKVDNKKVDINELEKFLINLDTLRKQNNSSKLLFSFVSTENAEIIKNETNILKCMNKNDNIVLGKQFFDHGFIYQDKVYCEEVIGKVFQIKKYLEELNDKYIIDKVYFADDNIFIHYLLEELFLDSFMIQLVIPSKCIGLEELNKVITSLLTNNKIKRIK